MFTKVKLAEPCNFRASYQNIPVFITVLFSIYVFTWYIELDKRIPFLGQIRFEFILGTILGIIAINTLKVNPIKYDSKLPSLIIFYFFCLVITLAYSQDFDKSWYMFFNRVIKLSFMSLFICAFIRKPFHLILFISIYLLVFMKIGQEELLGKITGSLVWENQGVMRLWGAQNSMYGHPASLSGTAIITLPFVYYLWPIVRWKWRILLLIQLIFVINIVIFTGARTGYVGFVGMMLAIFLRSTYKKYFFLTFIIMSLLAITLIPTQYQGRFESIYEGEEAEGHSKESRIELMNDGWQIFLDNPLGVGMGAFRTVRQRTLGKWPMDNHCLYLQILSETGVVGFIAFFLLLFNVLKALHQTNKKLKIQMQKVTEYISDKQMVSQRDKRHLFDISFMKAITDAVIVFIITRLILGIFGHDLYEIYWWFASGLTIVLGNLNTVSEKRTEELLMSPV
jgi:putative inorganic carbon (hco3(-)) transporter